VNWEIKNVDNIQHELTIYTASCSWFRFSTCLLAGFEFMLCRNHLLVFERVANGIWA